MMLRCKRWTFEAWYQSECTIIPSLAPWLAWYHLETLGNEIIRYPMHASFSFHHSNLQLAYSTQAWILKFKTYAMQANIWNAHSNATHKFMSLLPLHVYTFVWCHFICFICLLPLSYYLCEFSPPLSTISTKGELKL